jgi:hypothetical protein
MGLSTSSLLRWTEELTGLEKERVRTARERVEALGIDHVADELLVPTVDAAVAATLLTEGIERLCGRGVQRSKLVSKLRDAGQFWPTWAELRVASMLSEVADGDTEIELEPGGKLSAQPDVRLRTPGFDIAESFEIKSVGLSDAELGFCQRAERSLPTFMPPAGICSLHAPIDIPRVWLPRERRREMARDARRKIPRMPAYPRGLRGAIAVGRGTEAQYVSRVLAALRKGARQLPAGDECWLAAYWSNGAPIRAVAEAMAWDAWPSRIVGLILLGSAVAFPHPAIHNFVLVLPRGVELSDEFNVESTLDNAFATTVLKRFERSSGVRATLLLDERRNVIVRRVGQQRILPFNLLMYADPPALDRNSDWGRRVHLTAGHGQPQVRGPF